jgi:hypothetical protein
VVADYYSRPYFHSNGTLMPHQTILSVLYWRGTHGFT